MVTRMLENEKIMRNSTTANVEWMMIENVSDISELARVIDQICVDAKDL